MGQKERFFRIRTLSVCECSTYCARVCKSKRGHGGVCLFIRENISKGVHILETNNDDFIWIKLCKNFFSLTDDVCLCFAYIPPHDSVYFKSHEYGFFETLESGIRKYAVLGKIGIIGDLNARYGNRSDSIQNIEDFEIHTCY